MGDEYLDSVTVDNADMPPFQFSDESGVDFDNYVEDLPIEHDHILNPFVWLGDVATWVQYSELGEWIEKSPVARLFHTHQATVAEASTRSPIHEQNGARAARPETTGIRSYMVGPSGTSIVRVALRDRDRDSLLVKNLSNVGGVNLPPATNSNVYVSGNPLVGPGLSGQCDVIPPGGTQTYSGYGEFWLCADTDKSLVVVTVERFRSILWKDERGRTPKA